MWAVDTNVLVRYYTQDDPQQTRRAIAWLTAHAPCFVPVTVVLELGWVLQSAYEMPFQRVRGVLRHLLDSPAFLVESAKAIDQAITVAEQGLDFADAIHWSLSHHCEGLVSFDDKGFVRRAKRLGLSPTVSIPT